MAHRLGLLAFPNARHIEPEQRCHFDEWDDSRFRGVSLDDSVAVAVLIPEREGDRLQM
jgi:hypothetical protein